MIKMMLSAFLATLGFAVMFNIRGKRVMFASLGGGIAAMVYYLCLYEFQFSSFISLLMTSITIGIYSEIMARYLKSPVTLFTICALICFVPGGTMYYTMVEILNGNNMQSLQLLMDALISASALALGIVVVSNSVHLLHQFKTSHKEREGM